LLVQIKHICLSAVLSLLVLSLVACLPASTATDTISVTIVIDGDTVVISSGEKVRYIGIDTPELFPEEAFGQEATKANRELVLGKSVTLEKDVSETDKYDRLLRYVWVDGIMVNMELVRRGLAEAKAYPPDTKYRALLEAAESEAKLAGRGIWAQKEGADVTPPPE
jgi:micrococcal nuclease